VSKDLSLLTRLRQAALATAAFALLVEPIALSAQSTGQAAEPAPTGAASTPAASDDPALYTPTDKDERGLWMQMDEVERELKNSPEVIRDPALNAYVRSVLCKVASEARCANIRLYITRTPHFNATMAPNGVMQVWSGLLLRTTNEAQLAAILGHEYTHFQERHTLRLFRDIKKKTDAASFLNVIPFAGIISLGLLSSIFGFSREMERDADRGGLDRMAAGGYDTVEAARVWERLREEMDATAAERKTKSRKDKNGGMFATHPPSAERVTSLTEWAKAAPGVPGATGADRYRAAIAPWWPQFVDDQLKLNDFGASDYLLNSLAATEWTPPLLYARGELYRRRAGAGDLDQAVKFYSDAIAGGGEMPEIWRGRGLALSKLGQADAAKVDLKEYLNRAPKAPDRSMIAMLAGGE